MKINARRNQLRKQQEQNQLTLMELKNQYEEKIRIQKQQLEDRQEEYRLQSQRQAKLEEYLQAFQQAVNLLEQKASRLQEMQNQSSAITRRERE